MHRGQAGIFPSGGCRRLDHSLCVRERHPNSVVQPGGAGRVRGEVLGIIPYFGGIGSAKVDSDFAGMHFEWSGEGGNLPSWSWPTLMEIFVALDVLPCNKICNYGLAEGAHFDTPIDTNAIREM